MLFNFQNAYALVTCCCCNIRRSERTMGETHKKAILMPQRANAEDNCSEIRKTVCVQVKRRIALSDIAVGCDDKSESLKLSNFKLHDVSERFTMFRLRRYDFHFIPKETERFMSNILFPKEKCPEDMSKCDETFFCYSAINSIKAWHCAYVTSNSKRHNNARN